MGKNKNKPKGGSGGTGSQPSEPEKKTIAK